jgi:hypothetical protein
LLRHVNLVVAYKEKHAVPGGQPLSPFKIALDFLISVPRLNGCKSLRRSAEVKGRSVTFCVPTIFRTVRLHSQPVLFSPPFEGHFCFIHPKWMGGMVAQQFAAKYPDCTQRLVINCSAAKLDYAGVLTFRGWIEIAERFGVGSRTLAELIALQALSRRFLDSSKGPEAVDMIQNILRNRNRVDIFKLACQAMIDMDLRPLLPIITAPTLVIGGDEDMMTPWQQAESGAGQDYLVQHIKGQRNT